MELTIVGPDACGVQAFNVGAHQEGEGWRAEAIGEVDISPTRWTTGGASPDIF
eukprot:SAG11_NODE_2666_length_3114_cov_6.157877_5_plen_53_part_00